MTTGRVPLLWCHLREALRMLLICIGKTEIVKYNESVLMNDSSE